MPCRCNQRVGGNTQSRVLRSVCETHPCSTRENFCEICEGFVPPAGADCTPVFPVKTQEELLAERDFRSCTDPNGCTGLYPAECRSAFWPSFAHPRWLCCGDLYNAN